MYGRGGGGRRRSGHAALTDNLSRLAEAADKAKRLTEVRVAAGRRR
jgi:hypothetical protein